MPKFRVHHFQVVRVPVVVEAETAEEALLKSEKETDHYTAFQGDDAEWAEETTSYLVDTLDENENPIVEKARWFKDRSFEAPGSAKDMVYELFPIPDHVAEWWDSDSDDEAKCSILDQRLAVTKALGIRASYAEEWLDRVPDEEQQMIAQYLTNNPEHMEPRK
jgi:hypothetical protein